MKKLNLIIFTIAISILSSCSDELGETKSEVNDEEFNKNEVKEISIENGYLAFSSQSVLDDYMAILEETLDEQNSDVRLKSATIIPKIEGFVSLADKLSAINTVSLKSGSTQGTEEELLAELQRSLIPDVVVQNVIDTANRIKIAENIYKISAAGIFIYTDDQLDEFEELYASFPDKYLSPTSQLDSITYMFNNIKFVDTYSYVKNKNFSIDAIFSEICVEDEELDETNEENSPNLRSLSTNDKINSDYTNTYNIINVKNKWGKDEKRSFDSRHRMWAKLYTRNYRFYRKSGFTCKFQEYKGFVKKIKFWGWTKTIKFGYWVKDYPSETVIGIDYFKGYTEYDDFGLSDAYSTWFNKTPSYSKKYAGILAKIIFDGYLKAPSSLIKGWASDMYLFYGKPLKDYGIEYTDNDLIGDGYDAGVDALAKYFKNETSSYVKEYITTHSYAPRSMLTNNLKHKDREYVYLTGKQSYSSKRSHIQIDLGKSSGGVSFSTNLEGGHHIGGFTPNKFVVEEAYIFAAVKYDGVWKGIRIYEN